MHTQSDLHVMAKLFSEEKEVRDAMLWSNSSDVCEQKRAAVDA